MMKRLMLPLLALLALGAPGVALAQADGTNVIRDWERRTGEWSVARYSQAGTRHLVRCEMERSFPDGSVLRLTTATGRGLGIGFATGNDALASLCPRFAVRYWVDDEAAAQTAQATVATGGFASFNEPTGEPGSEDGLANGRSLVIRAGNTMLRFSLTGSNVAFRILLQCSQGGGDG